jgi:hypothetical protein
MLLLARQFTFADPEKIGEPARRVAALGTLETRLMLDYAIEAGTGGLYLKLTPGQYASSDDRMVTHEDADAGKCQYEDSGSCNDVLRATCGPTCPRRLPQFRASGFRTLSCTAALSAKLK